MTYLNELDNELLFDYDHADERALEILQHLETGDFEGACSLVDTVGELERTGLALDSGAEA